MKHSYRSNSLGENITRIRKSKNILQSELARRIGVDRSLISHYESGAKSPSISKIEKIAEVLEVSVDDLLVQHENPIKAIPLGPDTDESETVLQVSQTSFSKKLNDIYTPDDLTEDDLLLLEKYHKLDDETKQLIKQILG